MSAGLVAALVIAAALLCVAAGLVWWVNRPIATDRAYARQTLPLFGSDLTIDATPIVDREPDGDDAHAARDGAAAAANGSPSAEAIAALLRTPDTQAEERRAYRFAPPPGAAPVSSMAPPQVMSRATVTPQEMPRATATTHAPAPMTSVATSTFDGQSIRFSIPPDGTLQFLPGRLEITAGKDIGREIRFVRLPGPDGSRVTFGRLEGPAYRHVQLHDPTVSRSHAVMEPSGDSWTLTNLSTTNPVVLNDRLLDVGETHVLADDDRIEMGEVVFRYRAR